MDAFFPQHACQLVAAIVTVVVLALSNGRIRIPFEFLPPGYVGRRATITTTEKTKKNRSSYGYYSHNHASRVPGGHWEYLDPEHISSLIDDTFPYKFSLSVCENSYMSRDDCIKTAKSCPQTQSLMNWIYIGNNGEPYPRFDAVGFRRETRNSRIVFIGSSMMRQQVQALVWTLGFESIDWDTTMKDNCTAGRRCVTDTQSNITICHQFMGTMATKIYHEANYTLDHSRRGHGDSSCLLHDKTIAELNEFDVAFVQGVAWWTNLPKILDSPTSPSKWVEKMIPSVYYDATKALISKISQRTKTVFVLGQIGMDCRNKTAPEPFLVDRLPDKYGWRLIAPKLWDTALNLIQDEGLNVQVIDAREPLMQSVHAHPSPDCLHFCMNSAAVNFYLDMYWAESAFDYGVF